MNRRQFLTRLGIGSAIAAVAPRILAEDQTPQITWSEHVTEFPMAIDVSSIPDGMTLDDVIKTWRESGVLLYKPQETQYLQNFMAQVEERLLSDIVNMPMSQWGGLPPYKTGGIWPHLVKEAKEAKFKSFWRRWNLES